MKRIRVGIDLMDKEFEKVFGESLSRWFDIYLSCLDNVDISISDKGTGDIELIWNDGYEDENHVYVFSGIEKIRKNIIYAYGRKNGDDGYMIYSSDTRITGICSSCGGAGCTRFSLAFSRSLEGRTLYISYDEIPFVGKGFDDAPIDINRYLFELNDGSRISPDAVTYKDRSISHVRYHEKYNLLTMLEKDELLKIIRSFSDGSFDNIVIDLGCRIDGNVRCLMGVCDKIILVDNGNSLKEERYMKILTESHEHGVMTVRNMVRGEVEDIFSDEMKFIPFIEKDDELDEMMERMADQIRKI